MTDPTPTYPRLLLSEVPGYDPGGPVMVEWDRERWTLVAPHSNWLAHLYRRDRGTCRVMEAPRAACALILDPTGAASLARAVAARVGLDVSGGVVWDVTDGIDDPDGPLRFRIRSASADGVRYMGFSAAASGRRDVRTHLDALAIVARAVLT